MRPLLAIPLLALACATTSARRAGQGATLAQIEASCREGNTDACFLAMNSDVDVPSTERAVMDFEKSCVQGDAKASTVLGWAVERDLETLPGVRVADIWYQRACDQSEARACTRLALRKWKRGESQWSEPDTASDLFAKSCRLGDWRGCLALARGYGSGLGHWSDAHEAHRYALEALALLDSDCAASDMRACSALAILRAQAPWGIARDATRAAQLADKACAWGDLDACYQLASLSSLGDGVPADGEKALGLFRAGCRAKHAASCAKLIDVFRRSGGKAVGADEVGTPLKESCDDDGNPEDCLLLGELVRDGRVRASAPDEPRRYFEDACEGGEPKGCEALKEE